MSVPGQQFADWNSIDTSKPGLLGLGGAYLADKSGLKDWMNGKGISYSPEKGLSLSPVAPPSMGNPVSRGNVVGTPLPPMDMKEDHSSMINGAFGLPDEPKITPANEQQPIGMQSSAPAMGAVPPPPEMGGGIGDMLKMFAMG